jgi:hypothetical protein
MRKNDDANSKGRLKPAQTLRDGHERKKLPAGLASMVAILRQMRMESKGKGIGTFRRDDSKELSKIRARINRKFPGHNAGKDETDAENRLRSINDPDYTFRATPRKIHTDYPQRLTRIESQDMQLEYLDLRVLSDWAGLSVAQFVMVSHALSTERRAYKEADPERNADTNPAQYEAVRELLSENRRVLDAMEAILETAEAAGKPAFYEILKDHKQDYLARFEVIKQCAKAADRPDPLDDAEEVKEG